MEIKKEDFGKSMGDVFDIFNKLEEIDDFKKFYKVYWQICQDAIVKEDNLQIGDKIPPGKVYKRVRDNLFYLLGDISEMRANQAKLVWWFLYV